MMNQMHRVSVLPEPLGPKCRGSPLHLDRSVPQDFLQLPVTDWVPLQNIFQKNVEHLRLLAWAKQVPQSGMWRLTQAAALDRIFTIRAEIIILALARRMSDHVSLLH